MRLGWATRTKASLSRPQWTEVGVPIKAHYARVTVGNGDKSMYRGTVALTLAEALHFRRGLSRAIRELTTRAERETAEAVPSQEAA